MMHYFSEKRMCHYTIYDFINEVLVRIAQFAVGAVCLVVSSSFFRHGWYSHDGSIVWANYVMGVAAGYLGMLLINGDWQ